MSQPWMPLYVADYLADTRRLSTLEHGAYILLIMDYWRNGNLPDDDDRLARIVNLPLCEWICVRNAIEPLFLPGWKHKRIDDELARAVEKSKKASKSAKKRWNDANAYAGAIPTQCEGNANAMLSQPQSHITTSNDVVSQKEPPEKTKSQNPLAILETVLSPKTARDVVAHRKALKSPLTDRAAELLAEKFAAYGDAELAASTMIGKGWKGFEPSWDGIPPPRSISPASASPCGFYAEPESKQREAWNDHYRRTTGKSLPADARGGWWVPSEFPPSSEVAA